MNYVKYIRQKLKDPVCFLFLLGMANCSSKRDFPVAQDVTPNEPPIEQPDWAEPKSEGIYKVGKPYKVNGTWYFPKEDYNYDEVGFASWYGPDFHNKRTANGEIFDMDALSAAHKTLPLPSIVRVTNLQNGRSLILRVNDRGPFVNNRIIDVSRKAAQLLGFAEHGTTKVRVELLPEETMTVAALAQDKNFKGDKSIKAHESGQVEAYQNLKASGVLNSPTEPKPIGGNLPGGSYGNLKESTIAYTDPSAAQTNSGLNSQEALFDHEPSVEDNIFNQPSIDEASFAEPKPAAASVPSKSIYIQAGAFGSKENADRLAYRLSSYGTPNITERSSNGRPLYIVKVGPYDTNGHARNALSKIQDSGLGDARIVAE